MTSNSTKPGPVLRVRVKLVDGKWEITKIVKVREMTIPASEKLPYVPQDRKRTGFWIEAVDEKNKVLYRKIKFSPPIGVEIFEDDGTISRRTVQKPELMAEFLIPDKPEIKSLKIFLEEPKLLRDFKRLKMKFEPLTILPLRKHPKRKKRVEKNGR